MVVPVSGERPLRAASSRCRAPMIWTLSRVCADGPDAGYLVEGLKPALEVFPLGGLVGAGQQLVQVAVMADFVAGVPDGLDRAGMLLGGIARDEERGPDPVFRKQAEYPGQAGLRPITLV